MSVRQVQIREPKIIEKIPLSSMRIGRRTRLYKQFRNMRLKWTYSKAAIKVKIIIRNVME
jgi:hypothetical protein